VADAPGTTDVYALANKDFHIDAKNTVEIKDAKVLSLESLPRKTLTASSAGFIGIGGGSDGIQAALLAQMMKGHNVTPKFVISIRTAKTEGEKRTVEGHGGEIARGVYKILPTSTGSGRFLENLPANDVNMFIVTDYQDGTLLGQLRAVIASVGGVDKVIAVDTGGDSLYSASTDNTSKATPDQDLRVLKTLSSLNMSVEVETAIPAIGVDSPENAVEILHVGKAQVYEPSPSEAQNILQKYRDWQMDGSSNSRFGKTSLAWQNALKKQYGVQTLPIPTSYTLSLSNPWNPYVRVAASMSGIVFMNLRDHLRAIGVPVDEDGKEYALETILSVAHQRVYTRRMPPIVDLVADLVGKHKPQALRISESAAPFYPEQKPMEFLRDNQDKAREILLQRLPWLKDVPVLSSVEQLYGMKTKYGQEVRVPSPILSSQQREKLLKMPTEETAEHIFRDELKWSEMYIEEAKLLVLTNPKNREQFITISTLGYKKIGETTAREFVNAIEAGRSYTF